MPVSRQIGPTGLDVVMVLWIFSDQPLLRSSLSWRLSGLGDMVWISMVPEMLDELRDGIANLPAGGAVYGYDLFRVGTGPG